MKEGEVEEKGEDENTSRLGEWLKQNGMELETFPLSLHHFGGAGRGFIATRDIQAGELLISIPEAVLMSPSSLARTSRASLSSFLSPPLSSSPSPSSSSSSFSLAPNVVLCMVLACERFLTPNSFWSPYFPAIPSTYTISSNFTDQQSQMLQNKGTILEVQNQKESMMKAYESVIPILQSKGETLTVEQFKWAWGVVQTRACYLQLESGVSTGSLVLVPWADYLNHSIHADTNAYFDPHDHLYKMFTNTPFKKGEQVFISYGKHPNPVLLHYYGFAIDENPEDVVAVDITNTPIVQHNLNLQSSTSSKHKVLSHNDKQNKQLWTQKEKILTENGLGLEGKFTFQMGDSPISWNLLTVARILHATSTEISQKLYFKVFDDEMISAKNEEDTCNFFISIAENLLKAYETTSEEDEELLNSHTLPFVETCIVLTRKHEKQILAKIIADCKSKGSLS